MPKERLDKILASQNLGSRREVGTMIRHGAVTVNGVPARRAEEKADPETDVIAVSGKQISFKRYLYIMTVSYTHLDVYKRQPNTWWTQRRRWRPAG